MKAFIKALLSDSGEISSVRFMSIYALTIGSVIAIVGLINCKDLGGVAQLAAVFVGAAFTAKVVQKFKESQGDK